MRGVRGGGGACLRLPCNLRLRTPPGAEQSHGGPQPQQQQQQQQQQRRAHPPDVPPRPRPPATGGGAAYNPRGAPFPVQLISAVLSMPFAVVGGGLRLLFRTLNMTVAVVSEVARRLLPPPLAAALQGGSVPLVVLPAPACMTRILAFAQLACNSTADAGKRSISRPELLPLIY